jgi:hypothetical protein
MKRFFKIGCRLGFAAVLVLAPSLFAQTANPQGDPKPPANIGTTHQILVTGCMKRNPAGTYVITDRNGTTWELVSGSSDVDLSKHIFHAVSIAGKEVPSSQKADPGTQDAQNDTSRHELRVLTLQVLSRSCTR